MLVDMKIRDFIDDLKAKDTTLVGGSAAALVGSVGTALMTMVGNLTFGKKSYEALDDETKKVFEEYMNALRMPRDTEEQKEKRKEALAKTTVDALEVPLETAKQALGILKIAQVFADNGNAHAITDVGVGALMAYAAVEGALFNVIINLNGIKDEEYAAKKRAESDAVLAEAKKLRDEILETVYSRI